MAKLRIGQSAVMDVLGGNDQASKGRAGDEVLVPRVVRLFCAIIVTLMTTAPAGYRARDRVPPRTIAFRYAMIVPCGLTEGIACRER